MGGSLLANTGSDVKTFYFIDSHGGRFNDYYGTLGKFTYTYQKTGPATARFKTTWSSDAGNKGESTAELTFTSAYQGNFVATESMNNGTKKTVRGRFTVKSPTGTTIPSGAPTNPPADSTAIVVPTPTPCRSLRKQYQLSAARPPLRPRQRRLKPSNLSAAQVFVVSLSNSPCEKSASANLSLPIAGWSSLVARQAHNLEVVGSNPAPATNFESPPHWRAFFL